MDTTSTYILNIDENYPVAGHYNDSKQFNTNFSSIKHALTNINSEITGLSSGVMQQFQNNDFGGFELQNATLINPLLTVAPQGYGTTPIDSTQASFWPITLLSPEINFATISPMTNVTTSSGKVIVSITTSTENQKIQFIAEHATVISIGPTQQPYDLPAATPHLFEIWNDYSGTHPYVFVKKLTKETTGDLNPLEVYTFLHSDAFYGKTLSLNSGINPIPSLTLGLNKYTVDGAGANALLVTSDTSGILRLGDAAVVPNLVRTIITATNVSPAGGMATEIAVADATGIYPGATLYFLGTTTQTTVSGVSGNIITTAESYNIEYSNINDPITFINQQFTATHLITTTSFTWTVAQPVVMTLVNDIAANEYGTLSTSTDSYSLKGSVYADNHRLRVTFANPGNNQPNTFSINKVVSATNTTSSDLATVGYVNHTIPTGAVIMWYNTKSHIPYGWWLCDGSYAPNGVRTPDLRNRFISGGNDEVLTTSTIALSTQTFTIPLTSIGGVTTATGGTVKSILLDHTHTATATSEGDRDPGHNHLGIGANQEAGSIPQVEGPFIGPNNSGVGNGGATNWGFQEFSEANAEQWWTSKAYTTTDKHLPPADPSGGGIIFGTDVSVHSAGAVSNSTNHANLPPYRAMYFIYKWIGQEFIGDF